MSTKLDRAELIARLNEGIGSLTTENRWQEYLDVQSKFSHYSPRNALLIREQDPYATRVASYSTWESLGRQVRKGETSLRILAPMRYTLTDEETQDKTSVIRGFKLAPVFDVAQTEGEPLPEVANRLVGKEPAQLFDKLKVVAEELGFTVDVTTIENPEVNGDCNYETKVIRVKESNDPAQRTKTLAHEIGHAILHNPESVPDDMDRGKKELEAESVAYVVGQSFGLDSGDYSFGYVAGWAGDPEKAQALVLESASRIQKASDEITKRLDALAEPEADVDAATDRNVALEAEVEADPVLVDAAQLDQFMSDHFVVVPVGFDAAAAAPEL